MTIQLRAYQREAVESILAGYEAGDNRQLLVMATGTGKTETAFGLWREEVRRGEFERGLIISHTNELVYQPVERITRDWQELPIPGIVKAEVNDVSAPIVSASIQTLSRGTKRLDAILDAGRITHVWVDETHRIQAPTYQETLRRLYAANPNIRLLGTTATPRRTDGDGLRGTFDNVAYRVSIKDAIEKLEAITPFDAYAARLDKKEFDFSDVRTNAEGDYASAKTGEILSLPEAEEIIIKKWREVAGDRPTIAFTASVAQAHSLALAFREIGVVAEALDGGSKKDRRERVVNAFRDATPWKDDKPIQVLCGCMIFIEGFDAPRASCALVARPTQSDLTYIQMIGRCLRWHDKAAQLADDSGHSRAVIIDIVPKGARDLRLAGDLLGQPKEIRAARERAEEQQLVFPDIFDCDPQAETGIDGDPDAVYLEIMDLFGESALAWFYGEGIGTVGLGTYKDERGKKISRTLIIVMGDEERAAKADEIKAAGEWSPKWDGAYKAVQFHVYLLDGYDLQHIASESIFDAASVHAQALADDLADNTLSQKKKGWRNKPASDGQQKFAEKLGVWVPGISRGLCATLITHKLALNSLKKAGAL